MTQQLKCDYSVMPENFIAPNFVHLFSRQLSTNVLLLLDVTLGIRNWHNAKL